MEKRDFSEILAKYKFYQGNRNDKAISENNPYEITILEEVGTLSDKITGNKEIANFIRITDLKKTNINSSRLNFYGMLTPMDREKAKRDFLNLAQESKAFECFEEF